MLTLKPGVKQELTGSGCLLKIKRNCVLVFELPPGRMSASPCGVSPALMPDVLLSYINSAYLLIHAY